MKTHAINGIFTRSAPQTWKEVGPWMRNAEDRVERLDDILRVLGDLSESANKLKNRFKERMIACSSRYGFARLPDEIVMEILKITWDSRKPRDHQPNRQLEDLSLVCQRFRRIINSHAQFWTSFDNAWDPSAIVTALKRSKTLKLELSLYSEATGRRPITECLKHTMGLQFERLRSIHIDFASTYKKSAVDSREAMEDALEILGSANLPALEHFHMGLPTFADFYPRFSHSEMDVFYIYRTWNAPSLKHLCLDGLIPVPHESLKLRQLDLFLSDFSTYHGTEGQLHELLDFLSSQPGLQHLNLILGAMKTEESDRRRKVTVHLPELTSLSLDGSSRNCYPVKLLSALSTPAVEFMDIQISLYSSNSTLEAAFHGTYPSMKRLHLCVSGWPRVPLALFKMIFTKCPRLEVLQLWTLHPVDGELPTLPSIIPPPLRVMELISCEECSMEALIQALEFLKQGPHWEAFESLVIEDCPAIESHIEDLYSVVPASKVTLRRRAPDEVDDDDDDDDDV
jgi:hypothetical protein